MAGMLYPNQQMTQPAQAQPAQAQPAQSAQAQPPQQTGMLDAQAPAPNDPAVKTGLDLVSGGDGRGIKQLTPPSPTSKKYKVEFQAYLHDQLYPFIGNAMYNGKAMEVFLEQYQADKQSAIHDFVMAMIAKVVNASNKQVDFGSVFATAQTVISHLIQYAVLRKAPPMTRTETEHTTKIVLRSFMQAFHGQYDMKQLQTYLGQLQKAAEPGGEIAKLIDESKVKRLPKDKPVKQDKKKGKPQQQNGMLGAAPEPIEPTMPDEQAPAGQPPTQVEPDPTKQEGVV